MQHELMSSLAENFFELIPGNNALIDGDGCIVLVNQAWRHFGDANQLDDPLYCVGTNYLEICDRAAAIDATAATVVRKSRWITPVKRRPAGAGFPCRRGRSRSLAGA